MNFTIFFILILCALGLYGSKYITEQYQKGVLFEKIEKAAKKALRATLIGMVVLGLVLCALFAFPAVRQLCFLLLPANTISWIYRLLHIVFETTSVYAAMELFASVMIVAVQCSLLVSILGLFIVKTLVLPHILRYSRRKEEDCVRRDTEVAIPYIFRKIFLNFANLKI